MITCTTVDLFITHAWRFHDDWKRMVDLLNCHDVRSWRNFSLPWYDPALDPRTPDGGKVIRWNLESQIIPADAVILLSSLLSEAGAKKWLDLEMELATKHAKPIIAVPATGQSSVPETAVALAHAVAEWDARSLLETVATLRQQPRDRQ